MEDDYSLFGYDPINYGGYYTPDPYDLGTNLNPNDYDPTQEMYFDPETGTSINWGQILQYGSPVLSSGLGLLGNALGSSAYGTASAQQIEALRQAQELSQLQYLENTERMQPYYAMGLQGVEQMSPFLASLEPYNYSMYQNSPEYQAQMVATENAQNQLVGNAAGSGMMGSGNLSLALQQRAQQDALAGYQQGLGNYWGQLNNYYNMLSPTISSGQNAALNQATLGTGNVANQVNALQGIGQSQASSTLGQASQWSQGLQSLGQGLSTVAGLAGV